jgi:hypothetical protein
VNPDLGAEAAAALLSRLALLSLLSHVGISHSNKDSIVRCCRSAVVDVNLVKLCGLGLPYCVKNRPDSPHACDPFQPVRSSTFEVILPSFLAKPLPAARLSFRTQSIHDCEADGIPPRIRSIYRPGRIP